MATVYTLNEIRRKMADAETGFMLDCLMLLYRCQTATEQNSKQTIVKNGKGFNAKDATTLCRCAEANESPYGLTAEQMEQVKIRLPKYAKQIRNIWNGKQSLIS